MEGTGEFVELCGWVSPTNLASEVIIHRGQLIGWSKDYSNMGNWCILL